MMTGRASLSMIFLILQISHFMPISSCDTKITDRPADSKLEKWRDSPVVVLLPSGMCFFFFFFEV
jgi:hypothetical protein